MLKMIVSNQLIVESKNDEAFFRALVDHLNLKNIEIGAPICRIDDYDCLEGLNLKKRSFSSCLLNKRLFFV